jgi:hypothetical protein
MRSDIESLIRKFDDLCGESPTEMGTAALQELDALRLALKSVIGLAMGMREDDPWIFDNNGGGEIIERARSALKAGNE